MPLPHHLPHLPRPPRPAELLAVQILVHASSHEQLCTDPLQSISWPNLMPLALKASFGMQKTLFFFTERVLLESKAGHEA